MSRPAPVLEVEGLTLDLHGAADQHALVSGVSLTVRRGQVTALIGESGSGKSLTSLAVLGLLPPAVSVAEGTIRLEGDDLLAPPARGRGGRRAHRGRVGAIFQDPANSLNPTMRIGDQIAEPRRLHRGESRKQALAAAESLLDRVHVAGGASTLRRYPHELSGGMQQRVMLAMAIACEPALLIADEPTTALDVTIQAEILSLLRELCRDLDMGILLVTHDLGVVANVADEVVVLYAGEVQERATVHSTFATPRHPYTEALLGSIPRLSTRQDRLPTLPGRVPPPGHIPEGCRFRTRCSHATDVCSTSTALVDVDDGHLTRCTRVVAGDLVLAGPT